MPSKMMRAVLAIAAAAAAGLGLAGRASAQNAQTGCDRACLVGITDRYLAALAAHDPSKAPLAPGVLFVENLERLQPGQGLWKTETGGPTAFSIHVPDVTLQQAGWMGVVQQDGKPMMLAVRLKVVDGRITEAEHILSAPLGGAANPDIAAPRPGLLSQIPAAERLPHDRLMAIGASYYDALDDNDGSRTPFAADCQRRENGVTTAGEGAGSPPIKDDNPSPVAHDCKGQIDSGSFIYIKHIDNRRMVAADPQTGLVMGISQFRHPFDNLPYTVKHLDGSTSQRTHENMAYKPFDMPAAHIFKIGPGGHMHEIEAVGFMAPYDSPTGWDGTAYAKTWIQPK